MHLIGPLTALYILCFQCCAIPGIVRVMRRGTSQDLSVWREVLLLVGVTAQFGVMQLTGAAWQVWISPLLSGTSVLIMLATILRYRSAKG